MTWLLALLAALAQPAPAPAPVLSAEGRVTDASPRGDHDIPYAEHRLRLVARTRYRAIVTAPPQGGFDSRIEIRDAQPLAQTSPRPPSFGGGDGAAFSENRLDFVVPRTGEYRLRVLALGYEPRGAYAVRVVALPPRPAPSTEPATAAQSGSWQVWTGTLDASDPRAIIWLHDDYPLDMRAGETWVAMVERDGGPAYAPGEGPRFKLDIVSPDNPDGQPLDGREATGEQDVALAFQPARSGVYIVRVLGGNVDSSPAAYRLSITRLRDDGAATAP